MKDRISINNELISAHWNNSPRWNQLIQQRTLEKITTETFITQKVGIGEQQRSPMNQTTVILGLLVVFAAVRESSAFTAGIGNMGINGKRDLAVKVS